MHPARIPRVLHVFRTRPAYVLDASSTHSGHIVHTFWTHPAHVMDTSRIWQKGHCSYVSLAAALSQGLHSHGCILCTLQTHPVCIPDASCTCFRHVQTLELSCIVCILNAKKISFCKVLQVFWGELWPASEEYNYPTSFV